jgi:hypothetical protein
MQSIIKKILTIITITILMIFGLCFVRYGQSPKYFSQDGQYSFYSKRSIFGITLMSMPGDGDTGGGTIYVYDEIEKNVISQFESSWLRADMGMCDFSNYDGGIFSCKAEFRFNLPRPIKKMSLRIDKNLKSEFNIVLKTNYETAQKAMYFYKSWDKNRYIYDIRIPNKKLTIRTMIIVEEKASDILNITLDSILHHNVGGNTVGYYREPNKDDIDFAEKLTKIEIENLFREQVYKQNEKK